MTPEERNLVTDLFDRLARLEESPRDREAERLIQDGLRQAPNATYALVQTTLIQDEALKRADGRIRELEAQLGTNAEPPRQGGFLEACARACLDARRRAPGRLGADGARPGGESARWAPHPPTAPMRRRWHRLNDGAAALSWRLVSGDGSRDRTRAVIGGSLMMDSIRSMMGHQGSGTTRRIRTGRRRSGIALGRQQHQ
jgi:hypothetical protein